MKNPLKPIGRFFKNLAKFNDYLSIILDNFPQYVLYANIEAMTKHEAKKQALTNLQNRITAYVKLMGDGKDVQQQFINEFNTEWPTNE